MNMKKIALGAAALALVACNEQGAKKGPATIGLNSSDDDKFAYMLGNQFGGQNFSALPVQVGEELNEDAFVQGVRDNVKATRDTAFKAQMTSEELQEIGGKFSNIARMRAEMIRPDSATLAAMEGDQAKIRAYMDSVTKAQPINPTTPSNGSPVTISAETPDAIKFSYLIGMQFGNQLVVIGNQFEKTLDEEVFLLGVKDAAAKLKDTSFVLPLPVDTLSAVSQRFQQLAQEKRDAARKKYEEEEKKLKEEVASMKGDTLANGMPQKMNYKVKVTGISAKNENLEAFANKPVLMFYFSATCGHCQHAAPQILEMAKEFAPQGLTTVAVASGGNNKTGIRKFVDNAKFDETINVVWDEPRQFGELYSDGYVPKVYLVNPDGTYKQYAAFEAEKDTLKAEIAALLKGTPVVWNPEAPKAEEPAAAPAAK